ncbi:hypothetical protein [Clostridium sp. CTA-1]
MENLVGTYEIRKKLIETIQPKISRGIYQYINKHKNDIRFFLHYPLIDIEMGLEKNPAEDILNDIRRGVVGYLIENTFQHRIKLRMKKDIDEKSFQVYQEKDYDELCTLERDYRTLLEIKDGNSYAKSILKKVNSKRYKLITSLVEDKYREEAFYFYGMDDELAVKQEEMLIEKGIMKFCVKYMLYQENGVKIGKLENEIDDELLQYSRNLVMKDLNKLPPKVRSRIFKSVEELANVLSFLYYLAFVKRMKRELGLGILNTEQIIDEYLMCYDKNWLINKICKIYDMHPNKVGDIIEYFVNNGCSHLLEFPLFSHDHYIITIPSLIMINDWQFTIVNGHYFKGIEFVNRNKTISVSTQNKLKRILDGLTNVLYVEEKYYELLEEKENSDIDFAIYDLKRNIVLVIEAKWKDNHYYNGSEKRYPKIEDTLNKIFNEQIVKHRHYLSKKENIYQLFNSNNRIVEMRGKPEIFYLAVDKRNQLHLKNKHIITEYMLLAFIQKNIQNGELNLSAVIDIINSLNTKTNYISLDGTMDIEINDNIIVEVDTADLSLKYKF